MDCPSNSPIGLPIRRQTNSDEAADCKAHDMVIALPEQAVGAPQATRYDQLAASVMSMAHIAAAG